MALRRAPRHPVIQELEVTPFFTRRHRIEWGQCDPAGIVFAPRYFDMFTENTIRLFEQAGLGKKRDMLDVLDIAGFPMVGVTAKFMAPASYGDDVEIETAAPVFGRSSFSVEHRLLRDGVLCVECTEKRVWAVRNADKEIRSAVVPEVVRELFK
jgi:4-hydroxybenzoyl-CoA thioesterase